MGFKCCSNEESFNSYKVENEFFPLLMNIVIIYMFIDLNRVFFPGDRRDPLASWFCFPSEKFQIKCVYIKLFSFIPSVIWFWLFFLILLPDCSNDRLIRV